MNYNILQTMLDALNKRVRSLESGSLNDRNSNKKRFDRATERIEELEARIEKLEKRLNDDGK